MESPNRITKMLMNGSQIENSTMAYKMIKYTRKLGRLNPNARVNFYVWI